MFPVPARFILGVRLSFLWLVIKKVESKEKEKNRGHFQHQLYIYSTILSNRRYFSWVLYWHFLCKQQVDDYSLLSLPIGVYRMTHHNLPMGFWLYTCFKKTYQSIYIKKNRRTPSYHFHDWIDCNRVASSLEFTARIESHIFGIRGIR